MRSRVLFLSGSHEARNVSHMVRDLPLMLDFAASVQEARSRLHLHEYQVVVTEAALSDGKWLDVLHLVRGCPHDPQVILTIPQAEGRFWSEALHLGVYDLLAQPFCEPEVRRILSNACAHASAGLHGVAAV